MTQSMFLQKMGIEVRANKILKNISSKKKEGFISGANRIVDPEQMGSIYKFLFCGKSNLKRPMLSFLIISNKF